MRLGEPEPGNTYSRRLTLRVSLWVSPQKKKKQTNKTKQNTYSRDASSCSGATQPGTPNPRNNDIDNVTIIYIYIYMYICIYVIILTICILQFMINRLYWVLVRIHTRKGPGSGTRGLPLVCWESNLRGIPISLSLYVCIDLSLSLYIYIYIYGARIETSKFVCTPTISTTL